MDRPVKIVGKHTKDCFVAKAMKEGGWHALYFGPVAYGRHGDPVIRTTRRYGKNGYKCIYWLRYICNCTDCKAELHVNVEWVQGLAISRTRAQG